MDLEAKKKAQQNRDENLEENVEGHRDENVEEHRDENVVEHRDENVEENLEENRERNPPKSKMGLNNPTQLLKDILESQGKSDMENQKLLELDPRHPAMIKYQKNLKEHLLEQHQKADEQLYELNAALKNQRKENEEVGKRNCALQKQLIQCKASISKLQKDHCKVIEKKEQSFEKLQAVKEAYELCKENLEIKRKKDLELQAQVDKLNLGIIRFTELKMKSESESSILKQEARKRKKDQDDLEIRKLKQDLLITRLEDDKHNLTDKINLYKSQCGIKKDELADLRKVLTNASADMQTIHFEKLKLLQQWKYSIAALEKRDETCAIMRNCVRNYEDEMRTLNMDITSHKKSVRKELEKDEELTLHLLHCKSDISQIQKRIEDCKARQLNLEEQHAFFEQVVHHSDIELENLNNEKDAKEKELNQKSKELEKAYIVQREMEEEYLKNLHEKLTLTKTSESTEKLIKECRQAIKDLDMKCTLKEGEEARLRLKMANVQAHLIAMKNHFDELNKELEEKGETIAKSEAETAKGYALIEKKQTIQAELQKKMGILLENAGGQELGPMEREIASYKKDIIVTENSRKNMEQEWLRYQRELVTLTNEATAKFKDIDILRKKEAVLEEKKIRMEVEIQKADKEVADLVRSIDHAQNDITRISSLLYHEKGLEEKLQEVTESMKGEFMNTLKDAELDFVKKESEVENLRKERTQLLSKLMEAQQKTVLWEGKIRLTEEAKKVLKSETHADEIANLKSEIRRLQLKLEKFKKDEDVLSDLMGKAAFQHANLYTKVDIQQLRGAKKKSKQYFVIKTERLNKKVKEDKKKLDAMKREITSKEQELLDLKNQEEQFKSQLAGLMDDIKLISYDIDKKQQQKWQDIITLSFKQKQNKLLELVKEGKYVRAVRNENLRAVEIERLQENLKALQEITERFITHHPELESKLERVLDYITVGLKL